MNYLDDLANEIRLAVRHDAVPDEDTTNLFRLYAVLLLAKGESVTGQDVHNAWVAWKLEREEGHESIVPFDQLDNATQAEDSPFVVAIRLVARHRREGATSEA